MSTTEIDWGYNCLTVGIHHGRPEALWNLPLLQAMTMFQVNDLQEIVIARIYNDAMQFVEHGEEPRSTKEWAEQVKEYSKNQFSDILTKKMKELQTYYDSQSWRQDVEGVIERIKKDQLNPHYAPLHSHDSINMLCRILGTSASIEASKD